MSSSGGTLAQAGRIRAGHGAFSAHSCWELFHRARGVDVLFCQGPQERLRKGKGLGVLWSSLPSTRVQAGLIHLPWFWKYRANLFKMSHLLYVSLLNLRGQITKMSSKLKIPLGYCSCGEQTKGKQFLGWGNHKELLCVLANGAEPRAY